MDLKIARALAFITALFFLWLAAVDLPPGSYRFAVLAPIAGAVIALRWPLLGGALFLVAAIQHGIVQGANYLMVVPDGRPGPALLNGILLLVLPTLVPGVLLVAGAVRRRAAGARGAA